jgi:hypothetical protein
MGQRRLLAALGAVGVIAAAAAPAAVAGPVPQAPGCPMFPADSWWHADVSQLPVHPQSDTYVASMGSTKGMHADFGSGVWDGGPIGIPYVVVNGQPGVTVTFEYADESDHVGYPIPPNPPIEGGPSASGDRHVLIVDSGTCHLYELYAAYPAGNGAWTAGSGAVWDLNSNALRPDTWTSADAAGLPILPGLVRYDEVASGHIDHAIRVTANRTQRSYLWPARHQAGSNDSSAPPMGLRLRLKPGVDIGRFAGADQVILQAMKTYGLVVADNGSSWYVSGVPDERWDNDVLHALGSVTGSDFEAVDASGLMIDPSSGQAAGAVGGAAPAPEPAPVDDAPVAAATATTTVAVATTDTTSTTVTPTSSTTSTSATSSTIGVAAGRAAVVRTNNRTRGAAWWAVVAAIAVAAAGAGVLLVRRRARTSP